VVDTAILPALSQAVDNDATSPDGARPRIQPSTKHCPHPILTVRENPDPCVAIATATSYHGFDPIFREGIQTAHDGKHFALVGGTINPPENDLEAGLALSGDAFHETAVDADHHLRCWRYGTSEILNLGAQLRLDRTSGPFITRFRIVAWLKDAVAGRNAFRIVAACRYGNLAPNLG
jgi:hypothetical protein